MLRRWDQSKPPDGQFVLNREDEAAEGLVAWYPLGMTSGPSTAYELSDDGTTPRHLTGTAVTAARSIAGEDVTSYNGSSAYMTNTSGVAVAAAPMMVGAWVIPTDVTTNTVIVGVCASTINLERWQLDYSGGNLRWSAVKSAGGVVVGTATVSGGSINRLHHCLGVEVSGSSRFAQNDGVAGTQNTTACTPATPDSLSIGAIINNTSPANFLANNTKVGEVCLWNTTWNAARRAALADPGKRFRLYYPLRSRKWMAPVSAGGFIAAWARRGAQVIGAGVR